MRQRRQKLTKLIAVGVLAAIPIFGWVAVAHAQNSSSFRSGNNTTVAADETVDSSLYAAGRTVDIAGTVKGDVYCAGQNVTISGHVTGDVLCAAQTVHISGMVDGDIRAAAQTLTLGAKVGHSVSLAGQSITTDATATIADDATIGGQDITLNGTIGRDLVAGSGNIVVNGQVGRNIQASVSQITLGNHAAVGGSLTYASNQKITRTPGSSVAGTVTQKAPPHNEHKKSGFSPWVFALWLFISLLLLALALILLIPQIFERASDRALQHLGKTFLIGLVGSILIPILIGVLLATVIGIPLAILVLMLWLAIIIVAGPFASFLLGRKLLQSRTKSAVIMMLVGSAILLAVYFIPFLGQIVVLVAFWFGHGMVLWQLGHFFRPHYGLPQPHASKEVTD
jgi:cytoskeletal protein CcmA (bactofilin family)